jgi:hypothetical protein
MVAAAVAMVAAAEAMAAALTCVEMNVVRSWHAPPWINRKQS